MKAAWIIIGILLGFVLLYAIYDRVSWAIAKYEEAKRSVIIIARHIKSFRHQIADAPNKGRLDEIFQDILVENARVAYVLGGVKLLYEVSDSKPFEKEEPTVNEDVVKDESRNLHTV